MFGAPDTTWHRERRFGDLWYQTPGSLKLIQEDLPAILIDRVGRILAFK